MEKNTQIAMLALLFLFCGGFIVGLLMFSIAVSATSLLGVFLCGMLLQLAGG